MLGVCNNGLPIGISDHPFSVTPSSAGVFPIGRIECRSISGRGFACLLPCDLTNGPAVRWYLQFLLSFLRELWAILPREPICSHCDNWLPPECCDRGVYDGSLLHSLASYFRVERSYILGVSRNDLLIGLFSHLFRPPFLRGRFFYWQLRG